MLRSASKSFVCISSYDMRLSRDLRQGRVNILESCPPIGSLGLRPEGPRSVAHYKKGAGPRLKVEESRRGRLQNLF